MKRLRKPKQFIKFTIIGVTNTLVNYVVNIAVLSLLKNEGLQFDYIIANITGFAISVFWSFKMNRRFTFKMRNTNHYEVLLKTYLMYAFTGIVLNNLFSFIFVNNLNISKTIIPLLNSGIDLPINFMISKFLIYKDKGDE